MRISKSGIARNGKRGGNVQRLNQSCKAYASAVASSHKQYDGHNGKTAHVSFARLTDSRELLHADSLHNAVILEANTNLPTFE